MLKKRNKINSYNIFIIVWLKDYQLQRKKRRVCLRLATLISVKVRGMFSVRSGSLNLSWTAAQVIFRKGFSFWVGEVGGEEQDRLWTEFNLWRSVQHRQWSGGRQCRAQDEKMSRYWDPAHQQVEHREHDDHLSQYEGQALARPKSDPGLLLQPGHRQQERQAEGRVGQSLRSDERGH